MPPDDTTVRTALAGGNLREPKALRLHLLDVRLGRILAHGHISVHLRLADIT